MALRRHRNQSRPQSHPDIRRGRRLTRNRNGQHLNGTPTFPAGDLPVGLMSTGASSIGQSATAVDASEGAERGEECNVLVADRTGEGVS